MLAYYDEHEYDLEVVHMIELKKDTPMLVSPDGTPIPRIMGNEVEEGYIGTVSPSFLYRRVLDTSNLYDEEGYRIYEDVGQHPEVCTPEHIDPLRLAFATLRGHVKLANIVDKARAAYREEGLDFKVSITANNSDQSGSIWAHHENLLARRELKVADFTDAFIANYVSRIVWAGAGAIVPEGDGGYRYVLSQRAAHIHKAVGSETVLKRPFVNTRDEPLADTEVFRRIHGIHGETLFSPPIMALRMASKSIILRACELGEKFDDLMPENPPEAIRLISRDPELKRTIKIKDGRRLTGVQLNREIAERSLEVTRRNQYLTPEEDAYGDFWLHVLTLLEDKGAHSTEGLRLFDWAVKQELVDKVVARTDRRGDLNDFQAAWKAELAYHAIYPKEGIGMRRVRQGLFDESLSAAILNEGQPLPPTRAKDRARAVRVFSENNISCKLDWDSVATYELGGAEDMIRWIGRAAMGNPYDQRSRQLDKLLALHGIAA